MTISGESYKPKLQWQPQHPVQGKDLETYSHTGYSSLKKRRVCENFVPNQRVSWAMKEAASGSFMAKQCGSQCQLFGDDSRKLCRMFCNGRHCTYGDRCRFLHQIPDKIRDISMMRIVPGSAIVNQNRESGELDCKGYVGSLSFGGEGNLKPALWKTKLCNNWKTSGVCPYGKACRFAHGPAELQNLSGHCALESWVVPTCALENAYNCRNETGNHFKQQLQETKPLKRKEFLKLCGIYADWIEDMTTLPTPSYK